MASPSESLATRITSSAETKVDGKAVDGGKDKGGIDCFALVDEILKSAGAKTAEDFGNVTPESDYVWGEAVDLAAVQPGDILQFRDHAVTKHTLHLGDRKWEDVSVEGPARRPHHSAVVVEVRQDGSVVVVEQNVKPNPHKVSRNVIPRLDAGEETRYNGTAVKMIITVTGTVKAYRPLAKPKKGAMLVPRHENHPISGWRKLAYYPPSEGGPKRRPGPLGTS
jgi:hypothetical protein